MSIKKYTEARDKMTFRDSDAEEGEEAEESDEKDEDNDSIFNSEKEVET